MGNYLSCTTLASKPRPGGAAAAACARVILPDGSVRHVPLPATAAELMMMDAPGHFLVDARSGGGQGQGLGARLAALRADEDLQLGAVYATFPMKRLGTPLAAPDVARLAAAAGTSTGTREARRASAKVATSYAVVVAAAEEEAAPGSGSGGRTLRLEEMVDDATAAEMCVMKHRLSNARCRRPTLETIDEENYLSLSPSDS